MPSPRALSRHPLGAMLVFTKRQALPWPDVKPKLCMVVGCWRWGGEWYMLEREELWRVCPQRVDWAQGYILLPSDESPIIYAEFDNLTKMSPIIQPA